MSLRKAINEKCRDCIYDPSSSGTWRQQVFSCSVKSCPLWHARPKPISSVTNGTTFQCQVEHDNPELKELS